MKVKKLIVFGMTMMFVLASCNQHPSFSSSQEALDGCKKQLQLLKQKQDASIEELSSLTSTWLEVQDSAYSAFGRDSSLNLKSPMAVAYFMVSDSIRTEIARLAFSKPRQLREVMYFKQHTAMQKEKMEKSDIYRDAVKYYEKLDDYPIYSSLQETMSAYSSLLSSAKPFRQGDELSMRFNRRIVQNALACKDDILSRKRLSTEQKANYRWMLIQPFMAIDDYSAAVLTKEQGEQLLSLSDDLPGLLERLDAKKHVQDKENNLTEVLSDYFLKSYLSSIL